MTVVPLPDIAAALVPAALAVMTLFALLPSTPAAAPDEAALLAAAVVL